MVRRKYEYYEKKKADIVRFQLKSDSTHNYKICVYVFRTSIFKFQDI